MVLVIFSIIAWICVISFALLPHRIPTISNVLTYIFLSIVDINKLTFISMRMKLIHTSTDIPKFLALILHRDIIFSITLLIMLNLVTTSKSKLIRLMVILISFSVLFICGQLLRFHKVITYTGWSILHEIIMLISLIVFTLFVGFICMKLQKKEGTLNG